MLRRRRKTPKVVETAAPRGGPASRSRRRPRPDAHVPPELFVPPQVEAAVVAKAEPAKPKAHAASNPRPERKREQGTGARAAKGGAGPHAAVLVTGFEPFGDEPRNPSWEICERLPRTIAGLRVEILRVPCEFRHAIEATAEAIERHDPRLVLCLGLAGGRTHMSVERVAINVDDARIADNAGAQPIDDAVAANGPPAYFATLPVKAMVAAMHAAAVPAEVSNSAGTYVCNHLMYGVLHFLAASGRDARAGFIHVPYSEEQVLGKRGVASMSLATMVRGVEAAITAATAHARDARHFGGSLD